MGLKVNPVTGRLDLVSDQGAQGPQGPPGPPGGSSYIHDQPSADDEWTIVHNLGRFPSISVVDTAGRVVEGAEQYIDENEIVVTFNAPFSGKAYLS